MATARTPTGFLDLPLELRQSIYTHVLPETVFPQDRAVYYPLRHPIPGRERTAMAHPILRQEMKEWMYKTCAVALTITPDQEMHLPNDIEWHRFRSIEIDIDYLSPQQENNRRCKGDFVGVKQTIASLMCHQPPRLPALQIWFMDASFHLDHRTGNEASDVMHPDKPSCERSWYQFQYPGTSRRYILYEELSEDGWPSDEDDSDADSVDEDGRIKYVTCLRGTTDIVSNGLRPVPNPLATLILDHFLDLPPCKSADVYGLDALTDDRRARPEHHCFDQRYWNEMCEAL